MNGLESGQQGSVPGTTEPRLYVRAVGAIVGRLLLQIVAGFLACALAILVCWLPRAGSPTGFRVMTAIGTGVGFSAGLPLLEWSQLVAECFLLVFMLAELGKALVRIARIDCPRGGGGPVAKP